MIYLIITILFFLFFYLLLFFSFNLLFKRKTAEGNSDKKFSIIIAAKNESRNIPELTGSLNKLKYPKENYELIFVDDNSTDGTRNLFEEFIDKTINYKIFRTVNKLYPGKKGALEVGIKNCTNPYILITDADCIAPPDWLKCYSQCFNFEYDFVIGIAPFITKSNFTNRLSCFENLRSIFLSFSLAGLGLPYNAAARNIGFKKEAYEKVSGYKNTTETVSGDDDLLLREMINAKCNIGLLTEKSGFVYSKTADNLKEFLMQRGRHTTTSFHYSVKVKIALALWHGLNIVFLFLPVISFLNIYFILPLIIKLFADIIIVFTQQKRLSYNYNFLQIIYFQIFYEILLIISLFNARFSKIKWK